MLLRLEVAVWHWLREILRKVAQFNKVSVFLKNILSSEQNKTYFESSCGMKGGIYKSQPKKWEVSKTPEQKGQHLLWSWALRRWRSNDLGAEESLDRAHLENWQKLKLLVLTWNLTSLIWFWDWD